MAIVKTSATTTLKKGKAQQQQQQLKEIVFDKSSSRVYFNFINSIHSPATLQNYEFVLKKFMQYHKVQNVDQLLSLGGDTTANSTNFTGIEDKVIDWLVYLRSTITYGSRYMYMSALLSFYEVNDISLRKKRIARFLGVQSTRKHNDRAYTTEEIKKMLDHATDIRTKVIVLLLASSGIRLGAVAELKIKHLQKIQDYNLYKITVYHNTREEYFTYCTPECASAIDDYLNYRQAKCSEKITDESPLIREHFDINRLGEAVTIKKRPEIMKTRGIAAILSALVVKAGIAEVNHSYRELERTGQKNRGSERKVARRSHAFRKFFNSNLVRAQVGYGKKERLLGHSLKLDDSYLRLNEEEILQEYLKAVDLLTINNEHRLKRKVVELTQKQDDIDLMKAEQRRKDLELREQMQHQQQQYQRMIEEFQERDRKEKEELRKEVMGYLKATRILVDIPEKEEAATTTAMKKSNKAYYLQTEDTETKETLKKAQTRAVEQLRKDTLARYSHRSRSSIDNRIQQQRRTRDE
jgi:integrase